VFSKKGKDGDGQTPGEGRMRGVDSGKSSPFNDRFRAAQEPQTVLIPTPGAQPAAAPRSTEPQPRSDGATQIFSPGAAPAPEDPMRDPPVGFVIVVAGPGKGAARPLGYGMNSIGRDPNQRVALDLGDSRISRLQHANIVYDDKRHVFFLTHGDSSNLTYLNDEIVLTPRELSAYDRITIGDSTLLFLPFCGPRFDWRDSPAS
jgi:hypothetical protein